MNSASSKTIPVEEDYYDILKSSPHSHADQIHAEYRALARQHHPDKTLNGAESSSWEQVRVAYETLRDPRRRAQYDRWRVSKLPITFEQFLRSPQAQTMHWSFDYQRSIEGPGRRVSDQGRWWASREAKENAASARNVWGAAGKKETRDVYDMFRNYEI
ncbi:DnaJ-domain-containing protein [Martensiomyces pterosporus]|nr:DnaJ-domain-containing protein [Martensiomyces pterosporus]